MKAFRITCPVKKLTDKRPGSDAMRSYWTGARGRLLEGGGAGAGPGRVEG